MIDALTLRLTALLTNLRSMSRRRQAIVVAALLAVTASAPALAIGLADGGLQAAGLSVRQPLSQILDLRPATAEPASQTVVWEGRDIDGDGSADVVNPTGQAPRGEDAYGEGRFGASRDGGHREHLGVDYVANAGQAVVAPISGFVTRIGYPYGDDETLRYVEISNPALHLQARVFYVQAQVVVGQAVRLGTPIGVAQTLQVRYPGGITDHVHLEMADAGSGRKIDAATLLHAHLG